MDHFSSFQGELGVRSFTLPGWAGSYLTKERVGHRWEYCPVLRRNLYGGFRHTLGGTSTFLDRNKKGVLADGDDIFTG